jgi:large subunit ribosomal protein L10
MAGGVSNRSAGSAQVSEEGLEVSRRAITGDDPVDRSQKADLISTLNKTFNSVELVVVTQQAGLTVSEITDLRRQMRAAGAGLKVAKNRLTRRALEGTRFQGLSDMFKGPIALAYSKDPVAAAKVAVGFADKNEKLKIVGGSLGERKLDVAAVKALATLPSLDEMRAKFLGLLTAPATRLATVLQAPAAQVARVVGAHARKKAEAA